MFTSGGHHLRLENKMPRLALITNDKPQVRPALTRRSASIIAQPNRPGFYRIVDPLGDSLGENLTIKEAYTVLACYVDGKIDLAVKSPDLHVALGGRA
jgi:hypothetical protein